MPLYTVRIFKAWGTRDSMLRWVNNYEVVSAATSPADVLATANALVAAEKLLHKVEVQFLSATISTWAPDSHPYNPLSFTTVPLSGTGSAASQGTSTLDVNVAFFVKFSTALGRSGKRFYRGCLAEVDVETTGNLRWTILNTSPYNAGGAIFTAFRNAMLPMLGAGASADKVVLAGSSVSSVERLVTDVVPGGCVVNQHDHRYFDRR